MGFFLCPTLLKKQKSSFFKNFIVHLCFDHQRKCYIFTEKRLEVNIISIIFHNITLYESLVVFFFWSRNEWSNVGLLASKNIHLIVSQDLLREQFLQCSKCCTWTIWIIISTLKISLCLSDITSAAHEVQIHNIMRKFAFDPLLKLMEGNLHCTGKVAGFCHHIRIVKEHQLFRPSIAGKVISRIWLQTITPNIL